MIPTIEDIITGLASGQYTAEQARRWIARHIQMAEERGCTHGVQGRQWHCGRGCEHPDVCMVIKAAAGGACEGSHGVAVDRHQTFSSETPIPSPMDSEREG